MGRAYIMSVCRWIYTSTSNTLDKKDGGSVTTQEVATYLVYHCYLAESCQQSHFRIHRFKVKI